VRASFRFCAGFAYSEGFDLPSERPDETGEFARDGDDDLVAQQSAGGEPTVARAQAQLRGPGEIGDRLGKSGLSSCDAHRDARAVAIGPGGLHQRAARRSVAAFGDGALTPAIAGGVLRGHQAKVAHEVAGIGETRHIPQFGNQAHRMNGADAAQRFERFYHRLPAPLGKLVADRRLQPFDPLAGFIDRLHVLFEGDLLHGVRQFQLGDPAPVRSRPDGCFAVADVVAQQ